MKNSFSEKIEKIRIENVHSTIERILKKKEDLLLKGETINIKCMYHNYHSFCEHCKGTGELYIDWVSYITGRY